MSKFDVPCQSFCPSHWQHIVHDTALCCSFNSCCEMRMTAHKVGDVMVCSCTIFHQRILSRCMRSMLHILPSTDKHMHHSSATMCSTHRQLPAPALAAAIPKHPPLSRPRSDGPEAHRRRAVSAPTAHLVPGCAGRSRPPPHPALSIPPGASCLKSRLVQILGWAAAGAASPAAGSCRCLPPHAALFSQPKGGRQTQPSGSAPPYLPGV